ncbi:MAG: phosphotransferase [Terracidiphilus sp.]
MDSAGHFYNVSEQVTATHRALRWMGRLRYVIPRDCTAQNVCWKTFLPGRVKLPMRAMAHFPFLPGSDRCAESQLMARIRSAIGVEAGFSCCRVGAPGPWTKDTLLFLDKGAATVRYVVKAGSGEAVDRLLHNEAKWLKHLRDDSALADHIPQLIAHRSDIDLCFLAESILSGDFVSRLGEPHIVFLRKLQAHLCQRMRFEDSRFYQSLYARLNDSGANFSEDWSSRFDRGIRRLEQWFAGSQVLLVASHNDFTAWNVRVKDGVARAFDWEYADTEQFPIFDPLHFVLMPMALSRRSATRMIESMRNTLELCRGWFEAEFCCNAEAQALAYLMNICTLYLWSVRGVSAIHPVLNRYAEMIDYLCRT